MADNTQRTEVEIVKEGSNFLRGTLKESLLDKITGSIQPQDTHLIKFHGSYMQTDRDLESERKKQKLEPLYSFMIRVRMPGGIISAVQWSQLYKLAEKYGNGTMKLTTRQTVQIHGILKRNLKETIKSINDILLTTLATCGDVNRNVMCSPNPYLSDIHKEVIEDAKLISHYLLPKTGAYHEIWLDKEQLTTSDQETEPLYGKTYLPRKFKIAIAIPPVNDTDVFSNDIGLIAIEKDNKLEGYNLLAGGGLGMSFDNKNTHPRLADLIGFVKRDQVIEVCEKIIEIQRDLGNRTDRKLSRLKYTIERIGLESFIQELTNRLGFSIAPPQPYDFTSNNDSLGWKKGKDGFWHYGLFVEGGRIKDQKNKKLATALNQIANNYCPELIVTGNQNLILANIKEPDKTKIEAILHENIGSRQYTGLRINSMACVALNTCPLAFAEAERYLPSLIDKIDRILFEKRLDRVPINIRMTGCPNGCARPYLAEIGLVGRTLGKYNLYLGADHKGTRLNKLYKEMIDEDTIIDTIAGILEDYANERKENEYFGDFVIRKGIVD